MLSRGPAGWPALDVPPALTSLPVRVQAGGLHKESASRFVPSNRQNVRLDRELTINAGRCGRAALLLHLERSERRVVRMGLRDAGDAPYQPRPCGPPPAPCRSWPDERRRRLRMWPPHRSPITGHGSSSRTLTYSVVPPNSRSRSATHCCSYAKISAGVCGLCGSLSGSYGSSGPLDPRAP